MKKFYEIPELDVRRFEVQEPITAEEGFSFGNGLIGDEDIEDW